MWTYHYFNIIKVPNPLNEDFSKLLSIDINNFILFNVVYLSVIEVFYYLWSYLTYKSNLSDWMVPFPTRDDLKPILKIIIFYTGIIIYYLIFNRISL